MSDQKNKYLTDTAQKVYEMSASELKEYLRFKQGKSKMSVDNFHEIKKTLTDKNELSPSKLFYTKDYQKYNRNITQEKYNFGIDVQFQKNEEDVTQSIIGVEADFSNEDDSGNWMMSKVSCIEQKPDKNQILKSMDIMNILKENDYSLIQDRISDYQQRQSGLIKKTLNVSPIKQIPAPIVKNVLNKPIISDNYTEQKQTFEQKIKQLSHFFDIQTFVDELYLQSLNKQQIKPFQKSDVQNLAKFIISNN